MRSTHLALCSVQNSFGFVIYLIHVNAVLSFNVAIIEECDTLKLVAMAYAVAWQEINWQCFAREQTTTRVINTYRLVGLVLVGFGWFWFIRLVSSWLSHNSYYPKLFYVQSYNHTVTIRLYTPNQNKPLALANTIQSAALKHDVSRLIPFVTCQC